MTRRDYILIAEGLKNARKAARKDLGLSESAFLYGCDMSAVELGALLERTNPRFDKLRFLAAAGVQP